MMRIAANDSYCQVVLISESTRLQCMLANYGIQTQVSAFAYSTAYERKSLFKMVFLSHTKQSSSPFVLVIENSLT